MPEFIRDLRTYYDLLAEDAERADTSVGHDAGFSTEQRALLHESLVQLCLLVESPSATDGRSLVSPAAAARRLLQHQNEKVHTLGAEIREAQRALSVLVDGFMTFGGGKEIEEVAGFPRIMAALDAATASARREVAMVQPGMPPSPEIAQAALFLHREVLGRGAAVRAVYQTATRNLPHARSHLRQLADIGGQVRTAQLLPLRLVLADETVAILFVPPQDKGPTALIIRNGPLIAVLRDMFEHVWTVSDPLSTSSLHKVDGAPSKPVGQRMEILRLLALGMSDDAIARKIGVSTRTIRRQTAEILLQLGAGSRFRAGLLAGRLGWVD
ncbi:putative Helix-turn-helix domain-containing protein [Frankia sp. AiPs1]|uniref:helix-turn-helix transcriptional regulator n=1 Tax=Frankia sp. AiPa1 TaxID=573492 RepID=UPI00202B8CE5|nr:helix-turn-helix domain-containing protein [Frankia sp. AiPa1]MCL9759662.1 helix-turn-helix domain-containing protein [Frankia sp. AiPa1]